MITKKLGRPVLSKLVQNYIRDYIITHKLRPGDGLPSEGQIAQDLGTSRSSVREAIKSLESLGVLEVRHGHGLFVRVLNFDAVLEVLSYSVIFEPSILLDLLRGRRLLESSIIPEVVHNIQTSELDKCREILAEWETRLDDGLPYSEQDRHFHQTLYQVVDNKLLVNLAGVFWNAYWSTEVNTIPVTASEGRRILEHHRAILQIGIRKSVQEVG